MRKYEVMCVFRPEDEIFNRGRDDVRSEITKLDIKIDKEEDMGARTLAYQIKDKTQGHYYLYVTDMLPEKVVEIEDALRHKPELLRSMVVRQEE